MAIEGRRSAGFADALGDLGDDDWTAKASTEKPRPDPARMRETAELVGFKSREGGKPSATVAPAAPTAPTAPARRRRNFTGRSEQVNVKATPEFKARFQALGAKQSWTDVVLLEKLIEIGEKQFK